MSGMRAALRLARANARRSKGRSSLVVLMVGLPVLVVTALATLLTTIDVSPREALAADVGAADALIGGGFGSSRAPITQDYAGTQVKFTGDDFGAPEAGPGRPWTAQEIVALLPPGSRAIPKVTAGEYYRAGQRFAGLSATELDLRDPMTKGTYLLRRGRFPAAPGEVVVSPGLAGRGLTVGSTLMLTSGTRSHRVVGIVADPRGSRGGFVVGLPGAGLAVRAPSRYWLVDTPGPVGWDDVKRLNARGLSVISRSLVSDPSAEALAAGSPYDLPAERRRTEVLISAMAITMVVLEIVLLAGPAFAVGIRRRRQELALVAAQGASGRQLRRIVLADALVLGMVAAVAGALGGVALAWIAIPLLPADLGYAGPFDVPVAEVAAVAALGVVSATLAAVVPARQAARVDVPAALAGRRGRPADRGGWPLAGLVMMILGVALTIGGAGSGPLRLFGVDPHVVDESSRLLGLIGGSLLTMLGLVALTPFLVGVAARLAARLPLPVKLAARDAGRNRGRTAPAVTAVSVATAGLVALLINAASQENGMLRGYQADRPAGTLTVSGQSRTGEELSLLGTAVTQVLPGVPVLKVYRHSETRSGFVRSARLAVLGDSCAERAVCPFLSDQALIGDADTLRYLMGHDDPGAAAALAAGKAVVFRPAVRDGKATLIVGRDGAGNGTDDDQRVEVPAVAVKPEGPRWAAALLPASMATDLRLKPIVSELVIDPSRHRVTPAEEDRVRQQVAAITELATVRVERGPEPGMNTILLLFMAAAIILVLGGTFVAAGLAAADARPDIATLGAIGAVPWTGRLVLAGQAWFIAATGVTLGAVVGFVPGLTLTWLSGVPPLIVATSYTFAVSEVVAIPWGSIAALVVLLPVSAALIVGVLARAKVPLTRRME